jgi:hypothetical protein
VPQDPLQQILTNRNSPVLPIRNQDSFDVYKDSVGIFPDPSSGVAPTAPAFRKYPDVRGGTEFARMVDALLKRIPEIRGISSVITHGPDANSIEDMIDSKLRPDLFEDSTLLGVADLGASPGKKRIAISPGIRGEVAMSTLGHEISHNAGFKEGSAKYLQNHLGKALGIRSFMEKLDDLVNGSAELRMETRNMRKPLIGKAHPKDVNLPLEK